MSILIKGMDMPKEGKMLSINIYPNGSVYINLDLECKKVAQAVPFLPYRRLIDADTLKEQIAATYYSQDEKNKAPMDDIPWMNGCNTKVKEVCGMIDDSPTIIEAEGE